jgi:hypothetical protein
MATQETTATAIPGIRFDSDGNPLIETDEGWVRVKAKYPHKPPTVPKKIELPPYVCLDSQGPLMIETPFGWQSIVGHAVLCLYTRADKQCAWGDGHVTKAMGNKLTIKVRQSAPHADIFIETDVSSINRNWKLRFPYTPKCGKPITYCGKPAGHSGQCAPVALVLKERVNGKRTE